MYAAEAAVLPCRYLSLVQCERKRLERVNYADVRVRACVLMVLFISFGFFFLRVGGVQFHLLFLVLYHCYCHSNRFIPIVKNSKLCVKLFSSNIRDENVFEMIPLIQNDKHSL